MADAFDAEAPSHERERLWHTIRETTNLKWQLLTKRPNQALKLLPVDLQDRPDVWVGCTAECIHRLATQGGSSISRVTLPFRSREKSYRTGMPAAFTSARRRETSALTSRVVCRATCVSAAIPEILRAELERVQKATGTLPWPQVPGLQS